MAKSSKGLHQHLTEVREAVYQSASAITDLDEGFYYTRSDLALVRDKAKRVLALCDEYERLEAGK